MDTWRGDGVFRSISAILIRYQVNAIIVWLLLLRDVAIYAVRVLARDWLTKSRNLQWLSRAIGTRDSESACGNDRVQLIILSLSGLVRERARSG